MRYHANAALTLRQRRLVCELAARGVSHSELARRFGVHRRTIGRWAGRRELQDRSTAPHKHGRTVVDDAYRAAVIQARTDHPNHGPKRIAHDLRHRFPTANVATVWRILHTAGLSTRGPKKRIVRPIPVGRHRVQLDIQHLPAIKGGRGRAYKISVIHLRTRMKYSEMHTSMSSKRVGAVLERAMARLPPFHLVVTDNAMAFTMAYTAHPERKTTFERTVERLGLRHWRIARGSPWQNGFIERSNRTDNDECFSQQQFTSSEERQYIASLVGNALQHMSSASGLRWTDTLGCLSIRLSPSRRSALCANLMKQYT